MKFFLGLEKSRQIKKNIQQLNTNDGQTVTENSQILEEQVKYYRKLYTSKANDVIDVIQYLESTNITKTLSSDQRDVCETEITIEECKSALFSMKQNKSPGADGLSVEFYQTFWEYLKAPFYNSLLETKEKKTTNWNAKTGNTYFTF